MGNTDTNTSTLQWRDNDGQHQSHCPASTDAEVSQAIHASIDKMAEVLPSIVDEQSRYLLCEWNNTTGTLTLVITNDDKASDAAQSVCCEFPARVNANEEQLDEIRFQIRDYLTTCTAFLHYSLLAAFHSSSRDQAGLL